MQKLALIVAGVIFLVVSLLHLARAFWCVAIYVGQTLIPNYASWIGGGVLFLLAIWMFVEAKK